MMDNYDGREEFDENGFLRNPREDGKRGEAPPGTIDLRDKTPDAPRGNGVRPPQPAAPRGSGPRVNPYYGNQTPPYAVPRRDRKPAVVIAAVVVFFLIAVGSASLLFLANIGSRSHYGYAEPIYMAEMTEAPAPYYYNGVYGENESFSESFAADTITALDVNLSIAPVTIRYGGDTGQVVVSGTLVNSDNSGASGISAQEGVLTIKETPGLTYSEVTIDIPGNLTSCSVYNAAGSIYISELNAQSITVASQSGYISCDSLTGGRVEVSSNTGDMYLSSVNAEEFKLNGTSGQLSVGMLSGGEGGVENVSGGIDITKARVDKLAVNSVSGYVRIWDATAEECEVSAVSSNIDLGSSHFKKLGAQTVSGGVQYGVSANGIKILDGSSRRNIDLYIKENEFAPNSVLFRTVTGRMTIG